MSSLRYDRLSDYELRHLPVHLAMAGRENPDTRDVLRNLLFDPNWLAVKLAATGLQAVEADFRELADDDTETVRTAIRRCSLAVDNDPVQFLPNLYARLMDSDVPSIRRLSSEIARSYAQPWLRPVLRSVAGPEDRLLRLAETGERDVYGAVLTENRKEIVSVGSRGIITVNDIATGRILSTGFGPDCSTSALTIVRREAKAITGSDDGVVREWDLSAKICTAELAKHELPVISLAVSADGRFVASGDWDGVLRISDRIAKVECYAWTSGAGRINALEWLGDSHTLLIGTHDGWLGTWKMEDRAPTTDMLTNVGEVYCLAVVSPGGSVLVGGMGSIELWDLRTRQSVGTLFGHLWQVKALAISPDGKVAASVARDRTLRIWDIPERSELRCIDIDSDNASAVLLMPETDVAITVCSWDPRIRFWRTAEADHRLRRYRCAGRIEAIAVSPDSQYVAAGSGEGELGIWRLEDGVGNISSGKGPLLGIRGLVFEPSGSSVLTADENGEIAIWECDKAMQVRCFDRSADAWRARVLALDGTHVYLGTVEGVQIWDVAAAQKICSLTGVDEGLAPREILVSRGGQRVLVGSSSGVHIWEIDRQSNPHVIAKRDGNIRGIALLPDEDRLAVATSDGSIHVWDIVNKKKILRIDAHAQELMDIAAVPGEPRLISVSVDRTVRVWDAENGEERGCMTGHTDVISAVAVSQDGRWAVSASWDCSLRLWDLASSAPVACFYGDHTMRCCAITPDSATVIGGDEGGRVHILRATNLPVT